MATLQWIGLGIVIGVIITYYLLSGKLSNEENNRKRLSGKYAEKFVPFLDKFKYNSEDSYFLGMPIDYIVFNGLNEGKIKDVVFIEVKTGGSTLSKRENLIKQAVKDGRIKWEELRIWN